jgi:hypothetical protein
MLALDEMILGGGSGGGGGGGGGGRPGVGGGGGMGAKNGSVFALFLCKHEHLPRQARDKHKENLSKPLGTFRFSQGCLRICQAEGSSSRRNVAASAAQIETARLSIH